MGVSVSADIVKQSILDALVFLKENSGEPLSWQDPDNVIPEDVSGAGAIMQAEYLLCFLSPLLTLKNDKDFSESVYQVYSKKQLHQWSISLLENVVSQNIYSGAPYVRIVNVSGDEYPFIDAACFYLSLALFDYRLFDDIAQDKDRKIIISAVERSLEIISQSLVVNEKGVALGWSLTNHDLPERPYKYATWSAIDALSDFFDIKKNQPSAYFLNDNVKNSIESLQNYSLDVMQETVRFFVKGELSDDELKDIENRNVVIGAKQEVREDEDDSGHSFNVWVLLSLMFLGYKDEVLETELDYLYSKVQKKDVREREVSTIAVVWLETSNDFVKPDDEDDESPNNKLTDRAFLPQFTKAYLMYAERNSGYKDKNKSKIDDLVGYLLGQRNKKAWDKNTKNGDFAIYITQRSIEALCVYLRLFDTKSLLDAPSDMNGAMYEAVASAIKSTLPTIASEVSKNAVVLNVSTADGKKLIARQVKATLADELSSNGLVDALGALNDTLGNLCKVIDKVVESCNPDEEDSDELKQQSKMITKLRETLAEASSQTMSKEEVKND